MVYIEVDSAAQAERISRRLWLLMSPTMPANRRTTTHAVSWYQVAGLWVLEVDPDREEPIVKAAEKAPIINSLLADLGAKATTAEKNRIKAKIEASARVKVLDLLPANFTRWPRAWFLANKPPAITP